MKRSSLPVASVFQNNSWIAKAQMPEKYSAAVTTAAHRNGSSMEPDFRAAMDNSLQKLTVHNRRSTRWASPPDLMFPKGFTQQAPARFLEKSVMSRRTSKK